MSPAAYPGVDMPGARTFYEILDIPPDATSDVVETGYQRALEVFGADSLASYALFSPEEAERARAEIERAYAVLRDGRTRTAYDTALNAAADKGAATTTFVATFDMPVQGSTSMSDLSMQAPATTPAAEPANADTERRSHLVLIASAVEEARPAPIPPPPPPPPPPPEPVPVVAVAVKAPEPAPVAAPPPELPPLPPAGPAVEAAPPPPPPQPTLPSSVPISLSPTDPPAAQPRFRRVRADDETVAVQVARPSGGTLPPMDVETAVTAAPLPEDGEINGALLQRLRETRSLTHRQVADATKVSVHYLKAMETNQFAELPSRVYLRGFLVQLARAYRVNPERLSQGYLAFAERYRVQPLK